MQQDMSKRLRILVVIVEADLYRQQLAHDLRNPRSKVVPTSFTSAASVIGLSPRSSKPAIEDDILRRAAKWATKRPISMACRSLGEHPTFRTSSTSNLMSDMKRLRTGTLKCQFAGYARPAFARLSDHHVPRHEAVPEEDFVEFMPARQI